MKKILALIIAGILICGSCVGCEQTVTKELGGEMTMELEPNRKLEMITWKNDDLWVLTREMGADETPTTYEFQESSNWGVFEGTVTLVESKE